MKAQELIAILQLLPPDTKILLSKDEEGNGFRIANDCDTVSVYTTDGHEVSFGLKSLTPDLLEQFLNKALLTKM